MRDGAPVVRHLAFGLKEKPRGAQHAGLFFAVFAQA